MLELAHENPQLCAITAAMPGGTGLLKFRDTFPKRLFDVGIAEEHAVSMAGGLAKQGMVPVVALYSTFLQRSFDQIIQDVALLGLHVVFAVDRAGLVGEDGPTHHGVFDVGFLRQIPGMTVLCPSNFEEMRDMLRWAVNDCTGPVAVRYPRGNSCYGEVSRFMGDPSSVHVEGESSGINATIVTYGPLAAQTHAAAQILSARGFHVRELILQSVTHFSREQLAGNICGDHIFVVEETASNSGISETIAMCLRDCHIFSKVHALNLGAEFVPHGAMNRLYQRSGLDCDSIADYIYEVLRHED